jgi:hypothetical protein
MLSFFMPSNLQEPLRIIILDDDHYPDGRVTKSLLPEFKNRGLEGIVTHFKTFAEYRDFLAIRKNLEEVGLIIMDSSLLEDTHSYNFEQTIPYTVDTLVEARRKDLVRCIMPASGNLTEGVKNNRYAEEYLQRRGFNVDWQQTSLSSGGLSENPGKICDKIIGFYENKYPGMISKEGSLSSLENDRLAKNKSSLKAESPYWDKVLNLNHDDDLVHEQMADKVFDEACNRH